MGASSRRRGCGYVDNGKQPPLSTYLQPSSNPALLCDRWVIRTYFNFLGNLRTRWSCNPATTSSAAADALDSVDFNTIKLRASQAGRL